MGDIIWLNNQRESWNSMEQINSACSETKYRLDAYELKCFLGGSIFELEDELDLMENSQVATVKIFKQYELGMQVKLTGIKAERTNIINIGSGGTLEYGIFNPSVQSRANSLIFGTELDGAREPYWFEYELETADKWTDIRVTQLLSTTGDYIYRLFVNNKQIHEKVNNEPLEIDNGKVWLSNPLLGPGYTFGNPAPAKIRNVRFVSHDCPANKYFDGEKCAEIGMWKVIQSKFTSKNAYFCFRIALPDGRLLLGLRSQRPDLYLDPKLPGAHVIRWMRLRIHPRLRKYRSFWLYSHYLTVSRMTFMPII